MVKPDGLELIKATAQLHKNHQMENEEGSTNIMFQEIQKWDDSHKYSRSFMSFVCPN